MKRPERKHVLTACHTASCCPMVYIEGRGKRRRVVIRGHNGRGRVSMAIEQWNVLAHEAKPIQP